MKNTLVILTLNEIEGVKALFERIPFYAVDEYFVVDGGSKDGTIDFFESKDVRIIIQDIKGRGEAFRIAVKEAKGDCLVFFSPDGNEDPKDIPKLIDLLKSCDMAIASRFFKGAQNEEDDSLFPWRAWANRIFTLIANVIWNRKQYITDTINGYRAIKKDIFKNMNIDAQGFLVEYQMSIRAMKLGLKVLEIPTKEGKRIGGMSTARSLPTGLLFLKFLFFEIIKRKNFKVSNLLIKK